MKTLNKAFATTLKSLRESAGLSQKQLSIRAGLDRTYVSLLERGQRQPTISTLYKLAAPLKVSVNEMVFRLDNQLGKK